MSDERKFWVRWTGTMVSPDGDLEPTDPRLKMFLRAIGTEFSKHDTLAETAVVAPGNGSIALSAVVQAADDGSAVNQARHAFEGVIHQAGGQANLPDGGHSSWAVKELVRLFEAEVKELQTA